MEGAGPLGPGGGREVPVVFLQGTPVPANALVVSVRPDGVLVFQVVPSPRFQRSWIRKTLGMVDKRWPGLLRPLYREWALGQGARQHLVLYHASGSGREQVLDLSRRAFRSLRRRRLVYLLLEGAILPLTPVLALLPGPNVFFYLPALLIWLHVASWRALRPDRLESWLLKATIVLEAGDG